MANVRIPLAEISLYSSFPLGKDKCTVVRAVADGTAKAGDCVKFDTTIPNKAILATVGVEAGIMAVPPGGKLGTAPTAGTAIEVIVKGICVALVVSGGDNLMMGTRLCAHATDGTLIPPVATAGSATSMSARVMDYRASDDSNYHIIDYVGLTFNSNTHA
jgi:hypothetical protein